MVDLSLMFKNSYWQNTLLDNGKLWKWMFLGGEMVCGLCKHPPCQRKELVNKVFRIRRSNLYKEKLFCLNLKKTGIVIFWIVCISACTSENNKLEKRNVGFDWLKIMNHNSIFLRCHNPVPELMLQKVFPKIRHLKVCF